MTLHKPFEISSRLLPALRIGEVTISIESAGVTSDGRARWRYFIDGAGLEHSADDLCSGVGGGSVQSAFESLLSFMSACGESVAYKRRSGQAGENADLFPADVAAWCDENSDELSMLACEIEETPDLITD